MKAPGSIEATLQLIRAGLYALPENERAHVATSSVAPRPFVTVSRQAGAGGRSFARRLVDRLNAVESWDQPWAAWDRELVTKVADEHLIPEPLVEQLESRHESPVGQFVSTFLPRDDPAMFDEFEVYRRVAQTIHALAHAGRAVVVGRGGVYATQDLPGGIHVRLVAPVEHRVSHMATLLGVPASAAQAEVHRLDRERDAFHRRYGSGKALLPEIFTITLNTAAMSAEQMVDCVLPLVAAKQAQGRPEPDITEDSMATSRR